MEHDKKPPDPGGLDAPQRRMAVVCCHPGVFWNMRLSSVDVHESWSAKIRNLRSMLSSHSIIALSETHCEDSVEAGFSFFCHLESSVKFYGRDMAVVLKQDWAEMHGITQDNVATIIPGVAMSLNWIVDDCTCWLLHFRLNAFSEDARCTQLKHIEDWVAAHVRGNNILLDSSKRAIIP